uniref:Musashi RNA-binding protein 2b n=1 Tax=Hucho hucho TaxID=62062 RepID=A0A4W5RJ82_9TELE
KGQSNCGPKRSHHTHTHTHTHTEACILVRRQRQQELKKLTLAQPENGGLSANTVVEDVKQYFEQFGKVRLIWKHRGKSVEDVVEKVCEIHFHEINNKMVECKKAQPKEVMFPPGTRGRARGLPYTMDAFMLGMGMLSYPNIVATYGRGYTGFAPSYSYQFPGKFHLVRHCVLLCLPAGVGDEFLPGTHSPHHHSASYYAVEKSAKCDSIR